MLVELGVGTLLAGSGNKLVALLLDPLPDTKLVLSGTEHLRLISGVLMTLSWVRKDEDARTDCNQDLHRKEQEELCPVAARLRSVF